MSYERALAEEIYAEIDFLRERKRQLKAAWITHSICKRHEIDLPQSDGAEFWRHCAYAHVREAVRRRINAIAGDGPDRDDRQDCLPGYEHLQAYYFVQRRGEKVAIIIGQMTDAEIIEKASEHDRMADACRSHAVELRDYLNDRRQRRAKRRRAG